MTTLGDNKAVDGFAKAISIVFHPGFQQFYLVVYFSALRHEPVSVYLSAAVCLFAFPTAFYMWYKKHVLREDNIYQMQRKDRFWPILSNLLGLFAFFFSLVLFTDHSFQELKEGLSHGAIPEDVFVLTAIVLLLNMIAMSITFFYKISLHMLGTASCSFVFYLIGGWGLWAAISVPLILAVAWSRLHLKGHTPPEVRWGTFVGVLYCCVILALMGKIG